MSKIVKLQLYKGEITYRANGEIATPNTTIKLRHATKEWRNFMNNVFNFGYTSAKVLTFVDVENKELDKARKELDKARKIPSTPVDVINAWIEKVATLSEIPYKELDITDVQIEVNQYFATESKSKDSESIEQLKKESAAKDDMLKKMEERLAVLESREKKTNLKTNDTDPLVEEGKDDINVLRARFEELKGVKPDTRLGIDRLKKAIASFEAEKY